MCFGSPFQTHPQPTTKPTEKTTMSLSPNTVTAGGTATGTVTLNRPSLNGSVDVDLTTGSPRMGGSAEPALDPAR
jgi:hypothetical protein